MLDATELKRVLEVWKSEAQPLNVSVEVWLLMTVGALLGGQLITTFNQQPLRCLQCAASFTAVRQPPLELACPDCGSVVFEREAVAIPLPM